MDLQQAAQNEIGQWLAAHWRQDILLVICCGLTLFCLAWAALEHSGLIVHWLPKRKTLAAALQKRIKLSWGRYEVDVGLEWRQRVEAIAQGRLRAGLGVDRAQRWLARLYDPLPFSPKALDRALTFAVIYTLAFWLLPWLAGASGKLGQAALLPDGLPLWERPALLLPLLPLALYYKFKRRFALSGWLESMAFLIAVAGAVAAAGAGAGAVAVAVAVAGAGAGAVAAAGAVAGAVAGAAAVAVAVAGAGAGAGTLAVYFAFKHFMEKSLVHGSPSTAWPIRLGWSLMPMLPLALLLILVSTLPSWLENVVTLNASPWSAEHPGFPLLFFLGWLPLLNAVFDFISVGLTQVFLARMQRRQWNLGWWLADAVSAVVLVLGLYWLVLGLLYALQKAGWGVDPHAIIEQFRNDPFSVGWLLLLALTNVLPTLLHWVLGLAGLWADCLGPKAGFAQQWAQQVLEGRPLEPVDAEGLADYLLFGYRWFSFFLALSLLAWSIWVFRWGLLHSLQWLA